MKKLLLTVLMVIGVSVCFFANDIDYSGKWTCSGSTYTIHSCYNGVYVVNYEGVIEIYDGVAEVKDSDHIVVYGDGGRKMDLYRSCSSIYNYDYSWYENDNTGYSNNNSREYETTFGIGGFVSGVITGALVGSHIGIAFGLGGAIAGTIPGAVIGGIVFGLTGDRIGTEIDKNKK